MYNWKSLWSTLLGLAGMVLQALLVWLSWKWFILSQFPVPELTYIQALGITVFVPVVRRLIDIPVKDQNMTPEVRLKTGAQMFLALLNSLVVIGIFKLVFF